ncbi:MAG: PspC domain-containing protein [Candidatus Saccharibacteria bacterium]|nr:MAG: PspC domain-containing protein [Candidatus Saccharibacteria bacterium]
MKEITRIHIAKTPYDVELSAKKTLEAYLKTLESYSDDTEIINDIEIRITEILSERGVAKGGVISDDDVTALKQQLGEPRDFMGDGDIAVGPDDDEEESTDSSSRKLFRDIDRGVAGGVLAGIAAFYKVNPVWTRLIFILVAFLSGGAAILVYLVLWIAVPPARTAADKLQMAGKPVTAKSIRRLNESETGKLERSEGGAKRIVTIILGIMSVITAAGAAIVTSLITAAVIANNGKYSYLDGSEGGGFFTAAFVLAVVSGALFTTLCILTAYASFVQKMTKRVLVSICVVIVLGLASFGTAIGLAQYGNVRYASELKANMHESKVTLPDTVADIKKLSVDSQNVLVQYVVSSEPPTATLRSALKTEQDMNLKVTVENDTLVIKTEALQWDICRAFWCDGSEPVIIVYGPALESVNAERKSAIEYAAKTQDALAVSVDESAEVHVSDGSVKTLQVEADNKSEVTALDATISRVEATIKGGASLELGTIETLNLDDQKSCPRGVRSSIEVWEISSGTMVVNGDSMPARTDTLSCTKIAIESEEE